MRLTPINTLTTMMMTTILKIKNVWNFVVIGLLSSNLCFGQQFENTSKLTTDTTTARRVELKDVTITAKYLTNRNSTYQYLPQSAKPLITVMGGTDVIRYIGTLPGVS